MVMGSSVLFAYLVFVTAVLGLCMGSFLNCLAWRMTHGESVLHGRSHCTSCGHDLGVLDLVPVLSWLFSRGRCRYCGERVSARYPATELFCGIMYVSIVCVYGMTPEALELIAFASVLLVLSLTDLDDYIIPNATIVCSIVIRLAYVVWESVATGSNALMAVGASLANGLAVGVPVLVLALIMDHVLGQESLGGGDVKLLFVAGMYFGWQQCLFLLVLACVLGIVLGIATGAVGDSPDDESVGEAEPEALGEDVGQRETEHASHLIPFGPAIAFSCWITMLVGSGVVSWYLGLFHL